MTENQILLKQYSDFIKIRRKNNLPAKVFTPDVSNAKDIAALVAAGGLVVIPWGKEERRIFCLIGCYDNKETTRLMNKVKGRPPTQPLAVGCLPEAIKKVALIKKSSSLRKAVSKFNEKSSSELTDADYDRLLNDCFKRSIGIILEAKKATPQAVTADKNGLKTVMIAGERDYTEPHDIYNQTLLKLEQRYGKVIAGTSANPSDNNVYSIFDQEEAYQKFKNSIDGFVKFIFIPVKSSRKMCLTSSTVIDLTGAIPTVTRWGNLHPGRFRDLFPDLVIPAAILKNINHEKTRDYIISNLRSSGKSLLARFGI